MLNLIFFKLIKFSFHSVQESSAMTSSVRSQKARCLLMYVVLAYANFLCYSAVVMQAQRPPHEEA